MLSNDAGSVYTEYATITFNDSVVRYRALLVGEADFDGTDDDLLYNTKNVLRMAEMLDAVTGPTGGRYAVTRKTNIDKSTLRSSILDTFAGADSNDVSLFYIASHGVTSEATGEKAGRLLLVGSDGNENITLAELAECLDNIPGTVIVLLNSCGSGAAIYQNGAAGAGDSFADDFNNAAVSAFAALDPVSNTGELRKSKFYVLTAAAHQESAWGSNSLGYSYFTFHFCQGVVDNKAADANGDGKLTLGEMYDYTYPRVLAEGPFNDEGVSVYQHVQVYPENSGFVLFK